MSKKDLLELIGRAKGWTVTDAEKEAQRRSFAFGNTRFENEDITRDTIDAAAESLIKVRAKD